MFFWEVYKTELRGEATQAYADGAGGLRGAWFQEFHWRYLCGGCAKATQGLPTTLFRLFAYAGAGAVQNKTQLKWSALRMPRGQVARGEKHVAQLTWKKTECGTETSCLEPETFTLKWSNAKFKSDVIVSRKSDRSNCSDIMFEIVSNIRKPCWNSACSERYCAPLFENMGFSKHPLLYQQHALLYQQHPLFSQASDHF